VNSRPWRDGRSLLAAMAVAFGVYMAWLPKPNRLDAWRALGVPALSEAFGDLRVVTSAWDCSRRGIDVLAVNPCDPWARPMNYPRLWLIPGFFGLGQSATVVLGVVICLAFLAAILALVGRLQLTGTVVYGLALGSPALLLGIERGNTDLVVFAVCLVGLLAIRRGGTAWTATGVALILLATLLKLYPVFALVVLVPRTRAAIGALAIAAVYALLTRPDLVLISQSTPRPTLFAYGIEPAGAAIGLAPWIVGVGLVIASLAISLGGVFREAADEPVDAMARDAFLIGTAMFIGTYLIGSNWVYRLLLLVLTMPQLLSWIRIPRTRPLAVHILVGVLALMWLSAAALEPGLGNNEFQALSGAVFVALGAAAIAILRQRASAMLTPGLLNFGRVGNLPQLRSVDRERQS
jgi:hypothetical protein